MDRDHIFKSYSEEKYLENVYDWSVSQKVLSLSANERKVMSTWGRFLWTMINEQKNDLEKQVICEIQISVNFFVFRNLGQNIICDKSIECSYDLNHILLSDDNKVY